MSRVTKAVFPVAGLGTRFLPATKASPKEMLPIVDKPLIQYAAEEAFDAGITELIFITGRNKRSIEDHFDKAYELEAELAAKNKTELLASVRDILPSDASCIYIRQVEALGLGHAVLCAKAVVGDVPFAVVLADDLMDAQPSVLRQLVDLYAEYHHSIVSVEHVPKEETSSYGIVHGKSVRPQLHKMDGIVEKPSPDKAPSTLAVTGRYILSPRIFSCLEEIDPGSGGEYQLTDGIAALMASEPVYAHEFSGKRYDCGNKLGYLEATVEYALRHPELKDRFRDYLKALDK
ncbi:MAG: UTP--glucose-1-phosphate uridylyltransferase GalU [Acidiferrobacterales bacterium]